MFAVYNRPYNPLLLTYSPHLKTFSNIGCGDVKLCVSPPSYNDSLNDIVYDNYILSASSLLNIIGTHWFTDDIVDYYLNFLCDNVKNDMLCSIWLKNYFLLRFHGIPAAQHS